jgi:hypothetical protein
VVGLLGPGEGYAVRTVYKVLAWLIAAQVMIQAAVMVYAVAGMDKWIAEDGGVLDKATMEGAMDSGESLFPEMVGIVIHGMNGMMVIPAMALLLLIASFFAKVPGGIKWASFVLLAVVVQVTLGLLGYGAAIFGALHGINALILFSLAVMAGIRAHQVAKVERTAKAAVESEQLV